MIDVPVLIAGGGPVGLTASTLLSQHGVRSLLAERHPGTAILPKARGINARTMEMYRQCGIDEAIRAAGLPVERTGLIVWTKSLAGEEIERRVPGRATPQNMAVTPVRNCLCAQDYLEPVLRDFAERQGSGELRFSTEVTTVRQDGAAVTATLMDRAAGTELPVRAQYLIGADGAQSPLRRMLGVTMTGRERVYDSVNILFKADLRQWTAQRPAALYFVEQPDLRATFLTINAVDRWGFLVHSLGAYGYTSADFTPERSIALIRQAVGVPDLDVEILGTSAWEASALVAERYRDGRIFLAGDAAHEMPPTGGFGLNTGVQDVHNLAWKLAAVLHGQAGPALLDTYERERRPLGVAITEASLANSLSMGRLTRQTDAKLPRPEFLNEQGLIFGASYESAAVIPDGTPPVLVTDPVTEYVPVGAAGQPRPPRLARARRRPHLDDRSLRPALRPPDRPRRQRVAGRRETDRRPVASCPHRLHHRGRRRVHGRRRHVAAGLRARRRWRRAREARWTRRLASPRRVRRPGGDVAGSNRRRAGACTSVTGRPCP